MGNNRPPFVGSGRVQEGGALATRKQDFNAHWGGQAFRHDATNIDMNPPIPNVGGVTVQEVIESLHNIILSSGSGFISIGNVDGYAQGSYNVGTVNTPTFHDAFNAALTDVRLQNGGVILVLAGTYHLSTTINVPPGICVAGEIGGTLIIGGMPETPMFSVGSDSKTVSVGGSGPVNLTTGSNVEETKFFNLMLADNLDGYALFGEPTMTTVPMISCKIGSNIWVERVSFIGRLHSGAVTGRTKTKYGVGGYTTGSGGTNLTVKDCFFDAVKTGISFIPGGNEIDFLTVTGCKARTWGSETAGDITSLSNCYISMSMCNAMISNNYHIGGGSKVKTFLYVTSGNGVNTKIIVTGNTGGPFDANALTQFIDTNVGSTPRMAVTSNNWGTYLDNPWYITVGGGNDISVGDFTGVGAIDAVLALANTSPSTFRAIVIVNPGTYSVAGNASGSNNFANLQFIGNKHGRSYPIIQLSLTASDVDGLGVRPLILGSRLEGIKFSSAGCSIRPAFNPTSTTSQNGGGLIEVKDCIFENTPLYIADLGTFPWTSSDGAAVSTKIKIDNCHFIQNGSISDNLSLALPLADIVHIDQCYFSGNGYAFAVGRGYSGSTSSNANVIVTNVTCDMFNYNTSENYTISSSNLITASYIDIANPLTVKIDNIKVYVGNQFSFPSPNDVINSTLLSAGTFRKFINVQAEMVDVQNSLFTGPPQFTTITSVAYAIPSLFLEAFSGGVIKNCKFFIGFLPLQIGPACLGDATFSDQLIIQNCQFHSGSQTAIDFDLYRASQDNQPQIIIDGCTIQVSPGGVRSFHTVFTANGHGAIQLFAGDADVHVTNNFITGTFSNTAVTSITSYAALFIDAYTNAGTSGDQANVINCVGNTINVTNSLGINDSAITITSVYLMAPNIQCYGNSIAMNNTNTAGSNIAFVGCLVLNNVPVFTTSYGNATVTNNIFSRVDLFGNLSSLIRGYIQITIGSVNGGLLTDNYFDSSTYDGSNNNLVENNSSLTWHMVRNFNQEFDLIFNWSVGSTGIGTGADATGNVPILYGGVVSNSRIAGTPGNFDKMTFKYQNTTNADQFKWHIPIKDILPPDVKITAVGFTFTSSATITSGSGTVFGQIWDVTGTDSDTSSIVDTASHVRTITLSNAYSTLESHHPYMVIAANITNSVTLTVTIENVFVTYRY